MNAFATLVFGFLPFVLVDLAEGVTVDTMSVGVKVAGSVSDSVGVTKPETTVAVGEATGGANSVHQAHNNKANKTQINTNAVGVLFIICSGHKNRTLKNLISCPEKI